MVAGTADSNPPQSQQQQQPSLSAEDEFLKRNTDCVYFLASPLTCKKGSECEYRHSEYARVNPRDCWFWLNGSCLNPKCSFRHPPLDGLLGTQGASSTGSSLPTPYVAAIPVAHATYNHGKQAVPCIFFQKGFCVKGDKCAFSHGPNPVSNKVQQAPAAATAMEPPTLKMPMGSLQKCNQEQKLPQVKVLKSDKRTPELKLSAKPDTTQHKIGIGFEPTRLNDEGWRPTHVASAANGKTITKSNRTHQTDVSDDLSLQNGLDADDYHRESSPGFDVLVDDETGQSEYYHDDEQHGRTVHEGIKSMNEYDMDHSTDYDLGPGADREIVRDPRGYYSQKQMEGQYGWEQHRGSDPLERRRGHKSGSPDSTNESDLRHHLSKQRRGNGLRSVVGHDLARDNHNERRRYHDSRRDSRHVSPRESSLSSRLGGRIKDPRRSSPVTGNDLPSRREIDSGRSFVRLSPGRPQYSSHQGRLGDRLKGRVQEDYNNQERVFRGQWIRRDMLDDSSGNFAGPKSLAELKVGKNFEVKEQLTKVKEQLMKGQETFSLGKRKNVETDGHQQSEGDVSFEGPKPLSEILKRKRGETSASRSETSAGNINDNSQNKNKESPIKDEDLHVISNNTKIKSATDGSIQDGSVPEEKIASVHGQSSELPNSNETIENEEGMIVDEGMEYNENEEYDEGDGEEYDYEQEDGGEYNYNEGEENAYPDEEYPDEEDGDDFAKKVGVLFS